MKMIIRGLSVIKSLLSLKQKRPPLFRVKAIFQVPEVNYHPNDNEISNLFIKFVNNVKVSSQSFPRWKNGHCRLVEQRKVANSDEMQYGYTFYDDIKNVRHIINLETEIKKTIKSMSSRLKNN